jgi:hypothetical protein
MGSGSVNFGWTSAVGFFLFTGLGYWLDQKRGTEYIWTLSGVFVGMAFIFYELWKILRNLNNQSKKT